MEPIKALNKQEKREINDKIFRDISYGLAQGVIIGGLLSKLLRSKTLGLFCLTFSIGNSLRKSNDYILEKYKI